jgi:hypothetical protein
MVSVTNITASVARHPTIPSQWRMQAVLVLTNHSEVPMRYELTQFQVTVGSTIPPVLERDRRSGIIAPRMTGTHKSPTVPMPMSFPIAVDIQYELTYGPASQGQIWRTRGHSLLQLVRPLDGPDNQLLTSYETIGEPTCKSVTLRRSTPPTPKPRDQ